MSLERDFEDNENIIKDLMMRLLEDGDEDTDEDEDEDENLNFKIDEENCDDDCLDDQLELFLYQQKRRKIISSLKLLSCI